MDDSLTHPDLLRPITDHEISAMETDNLPQSMRNNLDGYEEENDDPFLKFIDYAKSAICPDDDYVEDEDYDELSRPSWNWVASRILKTCLAYSSGLTSAILLSDLSQAWSESSRSGGLKKRPECINQLQKKHKRGKLPNTITIDSIYEKNFLSLSSVLETVIVDAFVLPAIVHKLLCFRNKHLQLTLGDFWSSNTIDLFLHRRFYSLADPNYGILKKGREIFITGCYLRPASTGSGQPRLLPTEHLIVILDEDQDDDAMLIGAQFCSDSFASISVDAINKGVSYSLYARIESIGPLETHRNHGNLQRKQITLVDNDGIRMQFLLWGDQVHLANLFSIGSSLALDRPFVSASVESPLISYEEMCLEYGSVTQLYLVPFIQHEEQVCIPLTQRYQGSKLLTAFDPSQGPRVSQVALSCDSQGSINFSNYPFRSFVSDLRHKMTGVSLYGVVTGINRNTNTAEVTFSLRIEDSTGGIWAKLHFHKSWALGRIDVGHVVYISGLTCSMTKQKRVIINLFLNYRIEALWFENEGGATFFNLSCLPALLNSSCLHKISSLSDLSSKTSNTHICRVWLDQVEPSHVTMRFSHSLCGHFVTKTDSSGFKCNFCSCACDTEVVHSFHLKITVVDDTSKVFAWCTGQTATELLQISPDEFYHLPEEEQIMYPSLLEDEKFIVAMVNCRREGFQLSEGVTQESSALMWEITRALKCDD